MKVLYIVTAYPRAEDDLITPWLVETIHRLRPRGIEVEVLAPSYRGLGDQVVDGVRVHRFRYAPASWETLTHDQTAPDRVREHPQFLALVPPYILAGSRAAARAARTGGFDLVHAFWPLPHGILGMAAKRAGALPLVSTFFGVELSWLDSQLGALRPVVRRIVEASDAVTVISSHTEEAVRRLVPGAELTTIPFGATVRVETPTPARPREPGSPLHLLFVGRLVERKGVQVLLEAMALLASRAAVTLTVVGAGPMRAELEARASALGVGAQVEFAGQVSAGELDRRFRECDAFVLPAVRDSKGDVEGLGVVLIEALLHGRPVIASESGGIVDIVREGGGLLVPPGDSRSLAEAILDLYLNPDAARELASRGQADVRTRFSWDSIIDRLEELYTRTLSRHHES